MAKYLAADLAVRTSRKALKMLGGDGYMIETGAALYANAAAVFPIWEGTENIQLQTIARRITLLEEWELVPAGLRLAMDGYNEILKHTREKDLFEKNQALHFDIARVRSKLEAAIHLTKYLTATGENLAMGEYYSCQVLGQIIELRQDLVLSEKLWELSLQPNSSSSSYMFLDQIAGNEHDFKLRPSREWYTVLSQPPNRSG